MLTRCRNIVVGVVLLATYISADILSPCEKADDRVADKQSCTRYHICLEDPDSEGDFLTSLATCPTIMVFDMVTSTCVNVDNSTTTTKTTYLQDPAGCNTFYGCWLPSSSSEGYRRTRYKCPGELRFHPVEGHCTFITDVPDTLCNSHIAVQAILGQQISETQPQASGTEGVAGQSANISPDQTEDSATDPPSPPPETTVTVAAPVEEEAGDVETFDTNSTTSNGTVFRVVTPGERPAQPLTDIDKITQVIKGQLLTRRKATEVASKLK